MPVGGLGDWKCQKIIFLFVFTFQGKVVSFIHSKTFLKIVLKSGTHLIKLLVNV
jgi:hypothetical protein